MRFSGRFGEQVCVICSQARAKSDVFGYDIHPKKHCCIERMGSVVGISKEDKIKK
ncbi:hypothetical protein ACFL16_00010 [Patescibacteria group bacterium]